MKLTSKFQTYRTVAYEFQIVGSDPRSTGGVHLHQARYTGKSVRARIVQSNGPFKDYSPSQQATPSQLAAIAAAE